MTRVSPPALALLCIIAALAGSGGWPYGSCSDPAAARSTTGPPPSTRFDEVDPLQLDLRAQRRSSTEFAAADRVARSVSGPGKERQRQPRVTLAQFSAARSSTETSSAPNSPRARW